MYHLQTHYIKPPSLHGNNFPKNGQSSQENKDQGPLHFTHAEETVETHCTFRNVSGPTALETAKTPFCFFILCSFHDILCTPWPNLRQPQKTPEQTKPQNQFLTLKGHSLWLWRHPPKFDEEQSSRFEKLPNRGKTPKIHRGGAKSAAAASWQR